MYPLFETIRLEDGVFFNLKYHQKRMVSSIHSMYNQAIQFNLYDILRHSDYPALGLYKCKVAYSLDAYKISFHTYDIKQKDTLVAIEVDDLVYHLKYTDRKLLNELGLNLRVNEAILILQKGKITDTSYTNIVCKKKGEWFTPKTPLLKGTQRQCLIDQGVLNEMDIEINELEGYDEIALINAMIPFENRIIISEVKESANILYNNEAL